jgi:hypothetical protein
MKVFISSVIRGFEAYRDAASRAARALHHEVKRAEDFTASARFSNPEGLRDQVTAALRDLELSRAVGPLDETEMLNRARSSLPHSGL